MLRVQDQSSSVFYHIKGPSEQGTSSIFWVYIVVGDAAYYFFCFWRVSEAEKTLRWDFWILFFWCFESFAKKRKTMRSFCSHLFSPDSIVITKHICGFDIETWNKKHEWNANPVQIYTVQKPVSKSRGWKWCNTSFHDLGFHDLIFFPLRFPSVFSVLMAGLRRRNCEQR